MGRTVRTVADRFGPEPADIAAAGARRFNETIFGEDVTVLDDDVPMDGLDDELETLRRNYSGLVQQFWLERLGRILDAVSAIAVRESTCGFCGDRLSMRLDNGAIIKMKLLWPTRERFAALISLHWTDGLGWVLKARSTAGEAVTCYGWQASIAGLNTAAQW